MIRTRAPIKLGTRRIFALSAVLCGVAMAFSTSPAHACWGEYPRAEKAFRKGIEAFNEEDFSAAIELFREARDARREPDPSCTVQLYGRGPDSKAYYLPYYYMARSFFEGRAASEDAGLSCEDAVYYMQQSLKRREDTYDVYRRRFRSHLSMIDNIFEACGAPDEEDRLANRHAPNVATVTPRPGS